MKKLILFFIILCSLVSVGKSWAVSLSFIPSSQTINRSHAATVDLVISGLTSGGPPSLGAYALDITYNSAILSFNSVAFGNYLGDVISSFDSSSLGILYLNEVSLSSTSELDALQSDSFTLAKITFTGIEIGSSPLGLENVSLSDATGLSFPNPTVQDGSLSVVPLPSSIFLLGFSLACLAKFGIKTCKHD